MKRSLLVAWILLALGLPVTAQEESTLALKAAFPADLCASLDGFGGPGEPLLPIVVTVDPAAAGDSAQWDSLLGCGASRIQPVVLLEPPVDWQHAPDPYAALSGWLRDLEAFVAPRRGLVRVFQLGSRPELQFSARSYVYLLEKVGTLLHSIDPQATLLVGSIGDGAQAWLDEVDLHGLAPYVGGVALEDPIDLDAWAARMAREHPALRLWLYADASSTDPGAFILRYVRARAAGIQAVVATVAGSGGSELTNVVLNLVRWLPPRFIVEAARAAGGGAGGLPSENGRVLFFSDPLGSNEAIIALDPHQTSVEAGPYPVERVHAFDLVTGAALLAGARDPGSHGGRALIELPERVGPALIAFNMVKGPRGSPETVAVTERRALTVEEIIAGVQAFQAAQGRALDHYQAKATISYHYRAETLGQSIDVVSVNRLFWKAGTGEYEETDLFVNGARWRGKPPALPFIQAEKVREVPLEIRLDRSYDYRLRGEDSIRGRLAYVVEFEPLAKMGPIYSGEVWVDASTFAPLQIRLVQHGLKEPITSNTDVIEYDQVPSPSMSSEPVPSSWLPVRGYRQMVFTAVGRVVVAERHVNYEDFLLNSEQFDSARQQAFASGRPLLREDVSGSAYLVKEGEDVRVLRTDSLQNVAFFAGFGVNSDATLGTAFAGLNYFDFNWRNTGTQMDIAFAGLLADVAWTVPGVGKSRWEMTLDGRFVGISESFHRTTDLGRLEGQDVETVQEQALASFSHPLSPFQKAVFQVELDYDRFGSESSTDPNFVVPPSGFSGIGTARWNYHRKGYQVDLWFSAGHRFSWADWGLTDPNGIPDKGSGGRESDTHYRRGGLTAFKSFHPGKTQSLGLGVSLFGGEGLDRFSRFRIGDFRNARVRGFSSDDLTFDRGVTAHLQLRALEGGRWHRAGTGCRDHREPGGFRRSRAPGRRRCRVVIQWPVGHPDHPPGTRGAWVVAGCRHGRRQPSSRHDQDPRSLAAPAAP